MKQFDARLEDWTRGKPSGVQQVCGGLELLVAECGGATEDWTRRRPSGMQQFDARLED